jgi:MFS transporter, OFA family, oxalate/formate antiporter
MRDTSGRLYYGWFVLAAVSGMNFANGATAIAVLTVFIVPLSTDFGWTRTQIAAVTSVGAVVGALIAPFAGRLVDRHGARLPLSLGGGCIVLGMLNLAAMQSLVWFYLAFGLARLADQGFVQASSPPAIAKWFRRSQGKAMAILSLSSAAGGVVLPLLVHLVMRVWHWRVAWVMLGGVMLIVGLLPCVVLIKRQPEDLGLSLDGITASAHVEPSHALCEPTAGRVPDNSPMPWRLGETLHTPAMWFLLATACAIGVSSTGIGLHLVPYLLQQGLSQTAAVQTVSLGFLASGVSNLMWGLSADRLPVRPLLVATYALKTVSLAVLLGTHTVPEAYLFTVLQGIATGGLGTLTAILLADYYGRQHLGAIYGLLRAIQVIGFALGPLIAGMTFDITQSYHGAFVTFLGLSLVGTVLIGLAQPPKHAHTAS